MQMRQKLTSDLIDSYNRYINGKASIEDKAKWRNILEIMSSLVQSPKFFNVLELMPYDEKEYRGTFRTEMQAYDGVRNFNMNTREFPSIVHFVIAEYDLEDDVQEYDYKSLPDKNELWKEPDYSKLQEQGIPFEVLFWQKSVRDAIPNHPINSKGSENFKRFVNDIRSNVERVKTTDKVFRPDDWMIRNGYAVTEKMSLCHTSEKLQNTGIRMINVPATEKELRIDGHTSRFLGTEPVEFLDAVKGRAVNSENAQLMQKDLLTDIMSGVYGRDAIGIILKLDLNPELIYKLEDSSNIQIRSYMTEKMKEIHEICNELRKVPGVTSAEHFEKEKMNGSNDPVVDRFEIFIKGISQIPKEILEMLAEQYDDMKVSTSVLYASQEKTLLQELKMDSAKKIITPDFFESMSNKQTPQEEVPPEEPQTKHTYRQGMHF